MKIRHLSIFNSTLRCLSRKRTPQSWYVPGSSHQESFLANKKTSFGVQFNYHTSATLWKTKDGVLEKTSDAGDKDESTSTESVTYSENQEIAPSESSGTTVELSTARKVKKKKKRKLKSNKKDAKSPHDLVKDVSKELHPNADMKQKTTELEMFHQLLKIDNQTQQGGIKDLSIESLFDGQPEHKQQQHAREHHERKEHGSRFYLFDEPGPDAISAEEARKRPEDKSLWTVTDWYNSMEDDLQEKLFDIPSPKSAFEEQIMWTEQGKLWKFPIDNEQGVDDEEVETPFYKHVFLESKLNEGNWCPKTGAIRDFMTSLTTALSQNPYLSVKEKHDHIDWFRSYFEEKTKLVNALGLSSS